MRRAFCLHGHHWKLGGVTLFWLDNWIGGKKIGIKWPVLLRTLRTAMPPSVRCSLSACGSP
jgi:hypothetical protein